MRTHKSEQCGVTVERVEHRAGMTMTIEVPKSARLEKFERDLLDTGLELIEYAFSSREEMLRQALIRRAKKRFA